MKNLPINLETFSFFVREKSNGKYKKNKCGRDFLYYTLCYYGIAKESVLKLESEKFFGMPVPSFLAWTQIQFLFVVKNLKSKNLYLRINNSDINSWCDFVQVNFFSRINYNKAIQKIENCVNSRVACGIDIPIGLGGLLDHVIFVYGYDDENLYVFDTRKIPHLNYEKLTNDNRYFMKLSKNEIKNKWGRFGRVWEINKK